MEDLTKQQLILLTLLLSFVTSIATGIMTVSLLNEAPQEITQTINRVVEKTIERVVPVEVPGKVTETKEVKEVTVVVKEEELVIDSIDKNSKSIVRIFRSSEDGSFYTLGVVFSDSGVIVSPLRDFVESAIYIAKFYDGATTTVSVIRRDIPNNVIYLSSAATSSPYTLYPVTISAKPLKLGQSVIALGGETSTTVATGRVSGFSSSAASEKTEGTAPSTVSLINTDINISNETLGTLLVNLSGEMVGIKTSSAAKGSYLPVEKINITATSSPAL
jgi:S1-C subfamily serine protease